MRGALVIGLIIGVPVALIVMGMVGLMLTMTASLTSSVATDEITVPEPSGEAEPRHIEPTESLAEMQELKSPPSSPWSSSFALGSPEAAVEIFLHALTTGDFDEARKWIATQDRDREEELNAHGWFLQEVLPSKCQDESYAVEIKPSAATENSAEVGAAVHYVQCAGTERSNETMERMFIVKREGGAWRLNLGWDTYLRLVRNRLAATPYVHLVHLTHFELGTLSNGVTAFSVTLNNYGARALNEVVLELTCGGDDVQKAPPLMEVRAVDPYAKVILASGAPFMSDPIEANQSRSFVTMLSEQAKQCPSQDLKLLVKSVGLTAHPAKAWRMRGKTCGKPVANKTHLVTPWGERVQLGARCRIGRAGNNDLSIFGAKSLAAAHAVFTVHDGHHVVSTTHDENKMYFEGTQVNTQALEKNGFLVLGDLMFWVGVEQ